MLHVGTWCPYVLGALWNVVTRCNPMPPTWLSSAAVLHGRRGVGVLQALQCCVNILRSLVDWYEQTVKTASLEAAKQLAAQSPGVAVVGTADDASDDTPSGVQFCLFSPVDLNDAHTKVNILTDNLHSADFRHTLIYCS